jgi:hypothetical protein
MYSKASIIKMVNSIDDERFLQAVEAMLETYQQNNAVTYTVVSEPLNTEQYRKHIQQIIKEIEAGETISHEDLKKESETW